MIPKPFPGAHPGILMAAFVFAGCGAQAQQYRYDRQVEHWQDSMPADQEAVGRDQDPFDGATVLELSHLVRCVLSRNPSVRSARQSWRAAIARYPQAKTWDDPQVSYTFAPASIGTGVRYGQVIQVSQRFPWLDRQESAGDEALSTAASVRQTFEQVRRDLALAASKLFYDLYEADRAIEVNRKHTDLLEEMKQTMEALYSAGQGDPLDLLEAEAELSHLAHQRMVLDSSRRVIRARINGLLHRSPDSVLPTSPRALAHRTANGKDVRIPKDAIRLRPDVRAAQERIRSAQAAASHAAKAFRPDLAISGTYNSIFPQAKHRFLIGINIGLPLQIDSRKAAQDEAAARLAGAQSDLARATNDAAVEVEQARVEADEARKVAELYRDRILPVARERLEAALSALESGRRGLSAALEAEKHLRTAELERETVVAESHRREAALSHAAGWIPGLDGKEVTP